MKTVLNLMLALLVSGTVMAGNTSTSPKKVTECVVSYKVDASGIEDPMAASFLKDATLVLGFHNGMNRYELNMGAMMNMKGAIDAKSKEGVMLMDMMGNKIAIPLSGDEISEMVGADDDDRNVEYADEVKTIAGYKCKKAIITDSEGNSVTVFYTEEIQPENTLSQFLPSGIKGLPLEFSVDQAGTKMMFIAQEVDTAKQSDEDYSTAIPDGYQQMSFEDLQKMGGF